MLPAILAPIFCDEEKTSWELHVIVKAWVDPKEREVKQLIRPTLEWLIWICMKGRNEETSATEKGHERGHPPISKTEILAETAA